MRHKSRGLTALSGLQPSGRDEKFVMAMAPVTHEMHVGNSIPSDGPSVFSHNHLKLSRHRIEKVGKGAENPAHTINIR